MPSTSSSNITNKFLEPPINHDLPNLDMQLSTKASSIFMDTKDTNILSTDAFSVFEGGSSTSINNDELINSSGSDVGATINNIKENQSSFSQLYTNVYSLNQKEAADSLTLNMPQTNRRAVRISIYREQQVWNELNSTIIDVDPNPTQDLNFSGSESGIFVDPSLPPTVFESLYTLTYRLNQTRVDSRLEINVNAPPYYGTEFHGAISRSEADALLKKGGEGSYLVRESQRLPGTFTLCLRYGGCNKNYKLFYDGKRHYVGEKRLSSLESLVADGLITMHVEAKARKYLENMAEQAIYENSPYITLRGKQRNLITSTAINMKQTNLPNKFYNNLPTNLAKMGVENGSVGGESVYEPEPRPGACNRRFSVPTLLLEECPFDTSSKSLATSDIARSRFSKCLTKIQHQASIALKPTLHRGSANAIHPKSCLMSRKEYPPQNTLFTPLPSPHLGARKIGLISQTTHELEEDAGPQEDLGNEPSHLVPAIGNSGTEFSDNALNTDVNTPQIMNSVQPCVVMRKKNGFQGSAITLNNSKSEPFHNIQAITTIGTSNMARRSVRVFNGTSSNIMGSITSLSSNAFYPNPFGSLKYGTQHRPLLTPVTLTRPSQNPPLPPTPSISALGSNGKGVSSLELEKVDVRVLQRRYSTAKPLSHSTDVKNDFKGRFIKAGQPKLSGMPKTLAAFGILEDKVVEVIKPPPSALTSRFSTVISSSSPGPSTTVQCVPPPESIAKKRGTNMINAHRKGNQPRRPLIPFLAVDKQAQGPNAKIEKIHHIETTLLNGTEEPKLENGLDNKLGHGLASGPLNGESKSSSEGSSSLRSRTSDRNSPLSHALNNTCDSGYHNEALPNCEKAHVFKVHTFKGMHWCDFCGNFMWGLVAQGVRCKDCGLAVHRRCSARIPHDCAPEANKKWLKCRVFGVDLSCHVGSLNLTEPLVLTICSEIIESSGIDSEGIYRVPGYAEDIETLRQYFDSGIISHGTECVQFKDINVVAGVLKLYFRLLPIPLITFDAYQHFLDALKMETLDQQLEALKTASSLLPLPHYTTLKSLMAHLKRVSDHQRVNLMSASNLAMVFAPNLLRNLDSYSDQQGKIAMQESFSTIKFEGAVVEVLIKFQHLIFAPTPPSVE